MIELLLYNSRHLNFKTFSYSLYSQTIQKRKGLIYSRLNLLNGFWLGKVLNEEYEMCTQEILQFLVFFFFCKEEGKSEKNWSASESIWLLQYYYYVFCKCIFKNIVFMTFHLIYMVYKCFSGRTRAIWHKRYGKTELPLGVRRMWVADKECFLQNIFVSSCICTQVYRFYQQRHG